MAAKGGGVKGANIWRKIARDEEGSWSWMMRDEDIAPCQELDLGDLLPLYSSIIESCPN